MSKPFVKYFPNLVQAEKYCLDGGYHVNALLTKANHFVYEKLTDDSPKTATVTPHTKGFKLVITSSNEEEA